MTACKKELEELEKELEEKKNSNDNIFGKLKETELQISEALKEKERLEKLFEESRKGLIQEEPDFVYDQLQTINKKLDSLNKTKDSINQEIERMKQENPDKYNGLQRLSQIEEELNKLNEKKQELEKVLEESQKGLVQEDHDFVYDQLEETQLKISALTKEKEELLNKIGELSKENSEEDLLNQKLSEIDNSLKKLNEKKQELEKLFEESQKGLVQEDHDNIYNQLQEVNQKIADLNAQKNALIEQSHKNTTSNNTNDLENNIQNHKDNINLYYEILEDIKNLYNAIKNGLDLNSEQAKNMINSINERKSKLPESLNNELTNK